MNYNNIDYIQKNDPATKEDIEFVEKHINETIPKVYKEFLRYANGIVMNLCVLYDTSTIIESYECNEFSINMPGYISIGNDNGGQSQKFMKNLMNDRFQGSMNDAISFMQY